MSGLSLHGGNHSCLYRLNLWNCRVCFNPAFVQKMWVCPWTPFIYKGDLGFAWEGLGLLETWTENTPPLLILNSCAWPWNIWQGQFFVIPTIGGWHQEGESPLVSTTLNYSVIQCELYLQLINAWLWWCLSTEEVQKLLAHQTTWWQWHKAFICCTRISLKPRSACYFLAPWVTVSKLIQLSTKDVVPLKIFIRSGLTLFFFSILNK